MNEVGEARLAKGNPDMMMVEESMLPPGGGYDGGAGARGGERDRVRPTTAVCARLGSNGDEFSARIEGHGGQRDSYIRAYMHLERAGRSPSQERAKSSGGRVDSHTPENYASPLREQIAYHMVFPIGGSCVPALSVESSSTRREERSLSEEAITARIGRVLGLT